MVPTSSIEAAGQSTSATNAMHLVARRAVTSLALLARRTVSPEPAFVHDCRATRPGIIPWTAFAALAAWIIVSIAPLGSAWNAWRVTSSAGLVALIALAVLALFWLVAWEWRRSPLGICLGLGNRNVASLSVTQAIAWTVLLIAITLVTLLFTVNPQGVDGLGTLQAGLGVGTAAGSILALSGKSHVEPTAESVRKSARTAVQRGPDDYLRDVVKSKAAGPGLPAAAATLKDAATSSGHKRPDAVAQDALGQLARGTPLQDVLEKTGLQIDATTMTAASPLRNVADLLEDHVHAEMTGSRLGALYANGCPCEARLIDMMQGDETMNAFQLDPNKLQFIALTLLGMIVYVVTMVGRIQHPFGVLPDYPGGMLASLGMSSAAYVGIKLPIQTPLRGG